MKTTIDYKIIFLKVFRLKYYFLEVKAIYYSFLFKKCGSGLKLYGKFILHNPQFIEIGDNVSINDSVYLNGLGGILIGNNVSLSAGSIIVSTMLDTAEFHTRKVHLNKKITIGDHVQVGAGAVILPGVNIAQNVIIGAGSIVTKDIPSNVIVVGNPAKILRPLKERVL